MILPVAIFATVLASAAVAREVPLRTPLNDMIVYECRLGPPLSYDFWDLTAEFGGVRIWVVARSGVVDPTTGRAVSFWNPWIEDDTPAIQHVREDGVGIVVGQQRGLLVGTGGKSVYTLDAVLDGVPTAYAVPLICERGAGY